MYKSLIGLIMLSGIYSALAGAQTMPRAPAFVCDSNDYECITKARIEFLPAYQTECEARILRQSRTCGDSNIRCAGSGQEYTDIQSAINASKPGDAVCIRGGSYKLSSKPGLSIKVNGTEQSRIYIEPYPGEQVSLIGGGNEAAWNGLTDQKPSAGFEQNGIEISGDYITIRGLEVSYFGDTGIEIAGDFVTIEGLHIHNNWFEGISLDGLASFDGSDINGAVIRYNWMHNMRHGSGYRVFPANNRLTNMNDERFEFNLSYLHGYEPDGDKVPVIAGDPAGGGNSDSAGAQKTCSPSDNSGAPVSGGNICKRNVFAFNLAWESADDCYDITLDDYNFWGNIGWNCGPEGGRGFKQLRDGSGPAKLVGNFLHGGGDKSQVVGFEPRQKGPDFLFVNNGTVFHRNQGALLSISGGSSLTKVMNNLSWQNGSNGLSIPGSDTSNNWSSGDPQLASCSSAFQVDTSKLPSQSDGRARWQYIYGQFYSACSPKEGSPLIDSGAFVANVHCRTADDDPEQPYDLNDGTCWHWRGKAPDIGAFEY